MKTIKRQHVKLKRSSICPCGDNDKREKPLKYKQCCLKKMQNQEQRTFEMIHENKRIEKAKKRIAASIQHDIDHPILLPDSKITIPGKDN
ncbi:hypothetical protein LCGC14_1987880 [marine sediment metagenome]|uniref:Uncharacterized protein n=1 Tax=marine sediment metagenome TaxID=412755 RepID=A0A0F9F6U9_9ZZZZ